MRFPFSDFLENWEGQTEESCTPSILILAVTSSNDSTCALASYNLLLIGSIKPSCCTLLQSTNSSGMGAGGVLRSLRHCCGSSFHQMFQSFKKNSQEITLLQAIRTIIIEAQILYILHEVRELEGTLHPQVDRAVKAPSVGSLIST